MKDLTKKEIAKSLKELLLEKSLNKITIDDIAKRAGVNRQTFYYHFQDIIDLIKWICVQDAAALKQKDSYDTWQEGFLEVFKTIEYDKPFIMNIFHCVSLDILNRYLYSLVYPVIYVVVNEKAQNYIVKEEDKEFITNFYKYAFVAVVEEWIEKDMQEKPESIVNKLSILLEGTIERALSNLGRHK